MSEAIWTYNPVYPEEWESVRPKIFIVGSEANDKQPRPDRDMGLWFRTARSNGYWGNPKFFHGTLLQLSAMLGEEIDGPGRAEDDPRLLKHLRYVDLKATGGNASVERTLDVANWVRQNLESVVKYWKNDKPEITVLLGNHAQVVFEVIVAPNLTDLKLERVGLPHSSRWYPNVAPKEAVEKIRPLSSPLLRWRPRRRTWEEWPGSLAGLIRTISIA